MKKLSLFVVMFVLGICTQSFSQVNANTDYFAGKWEISIADTPGGNVKMVTDLVRKDGKLTGVLKDPSGTRPDSPILKVEEEKDKMVIYFESSQAGEVDIVLSKVDNDHLRGQLMNLFEATAERGKP